MFHTALVMQVAEGNLDAYRTDHQNLWPDVDHALRADGIDMAIYHHDGFLYIFAAAPSEDHWVRSRKAPVFTAWNARMAQLLTCDFKGNILVYSPEKVFGFGAFA